MPRTVLVTGVSRYLGGRFARQLSTHPEIDTVIGVDVVPPTHDLGGAQFVRADIRNPVIAKIIDRGHVDTVVHMSVIATPVGAGGRTPMKEINVIGSMQLLAACGKSTTLRRLVVKSTTAIYGGSPKDPACFTEEDSAKSVPRQGWGADAVEVEGYVRGFSRRRPDVEVAVLRFANAIGHGVQTECTDYFRLPVAPTVLGFDPRLQFVHEDDLIAALELATVGEVSGTVNVAGDGVLALHQALGISGRPSVPVPRGRMNAVAKLIAKASGVHIGPDLLRLLTYGRVVDTTRMRADLQFEPRFSTRAAFADLVASRAIRPLVEPEKLDESLAKVQGLANSVLEAPPVRLVGAATAPLTRLLTAGVRR